jgi:glycosyltransferase involved in cell wall biosynthesis
MATHNGARFIRQQIDSILPQLCYNDELVISDDHSTDGLLSILATYQDERIRILPPQHFGTPAKNFEYALAHVRNDIIFLADQDDVWHSDKIRTMRGLLEEVDLVVCDCRLTDVQLNTLTPSYFKMNRSRSGILKNLLKSSYMGCCMAFHRRVLERCLPFPSSIPMHDQWIGLVAERFFKIAFAPQILVYHRRHYTNYSSTGETSKFSFLKKLDMRLQLTKQLLLC